MYYYYYYYCVVVVVVYCCDWPTKTAFLNLKLSEKSVPSNATVRVSTCQHVLHDRLISAKEVIMNVNDNEREFIQRVVINSINKSRTR